ncbi:OBAP family protein [Massilia sp. 9096]|uniref:OBAP family protein n=1 Tax=Massilia sp. 9096 TaxID=1500894 RepID=UPI00068971C7|nr:OBAP family protein [Massilia sp. 9096]
MRTSIALAIGAVFGATCVAAALAFAQQGKPQVTPPGQDKTAVTRALEAGAMVMQGNAPLHGFDIYLDGFHSMKEHPDQQMEAHHFCRQVNEDMAQCALFDGNTANANLDGIEYIISEKLFATLPANERQYWHPHNGEILSGQLIAPGIPQAAEHELMKKKMNSYGKTWHVWNTNMNGKRGDALPLGPAMLAWSFSRDGELMPQLQDARDTRTKISTAERRKDRADLRQLARPQAGVDDLKGKYGRPTTDIPGVVDVKAAGAAGR